MLRMSSQLRKKEIISQKKAAEDMLNLALAHMIRIRMRLKSSYSMSNPNMLKLPYRYL